MSHGIEQNQVHSLILGADIIRYMGDRWLSTNLMASTYIWLPLTLSGTSASLVRTLSSRIPRPKLPLLLTKPV
jgi:hypothetical protein